MVSGHLKLIKSAFDVFVHGKKDVLFEEDLDVSAGEDLDMLARSHRTSGEQLSVGTVVRICVELRSVHGC
jgi:hypothetical protein